MKIISAIFLLASIALFSGCDESARHGDERTGTSVSVVNRVTIAETAITRIRASLGENPTGYLSVYVGDSTLLYSRYISREQIANYDGQLVCEIVSLDGLNGNIRCGWARFDYLLGDYHTDYSSCSNVTTSGTVQIVITIGDRREGVFDFFIDGNFYLY
jgi:hypothetical protein